MSTVTVTFTLPNETVTTQTTQGWQLGGQIDQAVAQLVRIGQGLVTIVVWAVIVGLPCCGAARPFLAWRLSRRLAGRNRPRGNHSGSSRGLTSTALPRGAVFLSTS